MDSGLPERVLQPISGRLSDEYMYTNDGEVQICLYVYMCMMNINVCVCVFEGLYKCESTCVCRCVCVCMEIRDCCPVTFSWSLLYLMY